MEVKIHNKKLIRDFEFENGPDSSEIIQADQCHDETDMVWKKSYFILCVCVVQKMIITICWTLSSSPEPLFPSGPQQSQLILAILLGRATERKKLSRRQKISF